MEESDFDELAKPVYFPGLLLIEEDGRLMLGPFYDQQSAVAKHVAAVVYPSHKHGVQMHTALHVVQFEQVSATGSTRRAAHSNQVYRAMRIDTKNYKPFQCEESDGDVIGKPEVLTTPINRRRLMIIPGMTEGGLKGGWSKKKIGGSRWQKILKVAKDHPDVTHYTPDFSTGSWRLRFEPQEARVDYYREKGVAIVEPLPGQEIWEVVPLNKIGKRHHRIRSLISVRPDSDVTFISSRRPRFEFVSKNGFRHQLVFRQLKFSPGAGTGIERNWE